MTKHTYLEQLEARIADMADLPQDWRDAARAEGKRVLEQVLGPRGLKERTILLIGGGGYIGIPVTTFLLERGYRVRCQDIFLYGNDEAVGSFLGYPRYEFLRGDIARREDAEAALDGVTDVIILAGMVGDPITKKYPDEHQAINEDGLEKFIAMLGGRGLNKVIMVSTCSNYGEIPSDALADENYELKPLSLYSGRKWRASSRSWG